MVDLDVLASRGVTRDKLKDLFGAEVYAVQTKAIQQILHDRLKLGLERNWREARIWCAIDKAYDGPVDQVKWAYVQNLSQKKLDSTALAKELIDWGLKHVMKAYCSKCNASTTQLDATTCPGGCINTTMEQRVDLPAFYDVVVGLIPAYLKMRWSKLFNDRDQIPFYEYQPAKLTLKSKMKCDIITDRAQMMATQFDYRSGRRQRIFQTLLYSFCIQAVLEEWYSEKHIFRNDQGVEEEISVKAGLRYSYPHPSKLFWDDAYPISSLNSDTGCSYFGYWHVTTWGELVREKSYFNTDKIKYQNPDWVKYLSVFQNYYPCSLKWPDCQGETMPNDREQKFIYYGQRGRDQDEDLAVVVCNLFAKLIPKHWGFGDYDRPVWFRFVMASEDTVIYAAPLPYTPGSFYGYDFDFNRTRNASMAVEVFPYQTIISNFLSQLLFSVEQNLMRLSFYNQDLVDESDIDQLKGGGARLCRGINFIGFSGREKIFAQQNIQNAFFSPQFPLHNIQEVILCIQTTINILERIMQFSSQELGVAATHEQTAAETSIIHENTSDRLKFSGGFIDDGENSDKRRIYEAVMAYDDDEMFAQAADLNEASLAALLDMGWVVEEPAIPGKTHAGIRGRKSALRLETFASNREGADRLKNPAIAASMVQLTQLLTQNPALLQAVGIPQVIEWFNEIFAFAGVPQDFKIRVTNNVPPEVQAAEIQKQMVQIAQKVTEESLGQVTQGLGEKVIKPMQEALTTLMEREQKSEQHQSIQDQALHEAADKINQLMQAFQALQQQLAPPTIVNAPPPGVPVQ